MMRLFSAATGVLFLFVLACSQGADSESCVASPASCAGGRSLQVCTAHDSSGGCTYVRYSLANGTTYTCSSCAACAETQRTAEQACGAGGANGDGGASSAGDGGVSSGADTGPPSGFDGSSGGPQILSFTATVGTITPSQGTTFIVVVADRAGIGAIAGGTLLDDTGATYAALSAGSQKSTYEATISWNAAQTVRAIDFGAPAGKRTFVAKFYDQQGATATASIDITLACAAPADGACDGQCADFTAPSSCGLCLSRCKNVAHCTSCAFTNTCHAASTAATCTAFCAARGKSCANGCLVPKYNTKVGGIGATYSFGTASCDANDDVCDIPFPTGGSFDCCCMQ